MNGTLDTSFGVSGKVVFNGEFNDITTQEIKNSSAGSLIYAAGVDENFTPTLWRLTNADSPDSTFAGGGKFELNLTVYPNRRFKKVIVQRDGRIILSGKTMLPGIEYKYMLRLFRDGSPDQNFGYTNIPGTNIRGTYDQGFNTDLELQSDDKIIISNSYGNRVRHLPDGNIDRSFQLPHSIYLSNFVIQTDDKLISVSSTYNQSYILRRTLP